VYIFDVYVGVSQLGSVLRYMFGNIYRIHSLIVGDWIYIPAHILLWGWAEMKFSAGTLTTKRVDRVVAYKSARMYATDYTVRIFF